VRPEARLEGEEFEIGRTKEGSGRGRKLATSIPAGERGYENRQVLKEASEENLNGNN